MILGFAGDLLALKSQIEFVKKNDCADNVREVAPQLWILVKNNAKKLQMTIVNDTQSGLVLRLLDLQVSDQSTLSVGVLGSNRFHQ